MTTMTRARGRVAGTPSVACADDPERMFPTDESERPGQRTAGEARALAVCASCPVLEQCRSAVLDGSAPLTYGVAGGMTREDRRAVRAVARRLSSFDPPNGVQVSEPASRAARPFSAQEAA